MPASIKAPPKAPSSTTNAQSVKLLGPVSSPNRMRSNFFADIFACYERNVNLCEVKQKKGGIAMKNTIKQIDKILEEVSPSWQADLEDKLSRSRNDMAPLQVDFNPNNPNEPKKANSDSF